MFLIVFSSLNATHQGWHEHFSERLLVDWNLNGHSHVLVAWFLFFWNDGTVFGIARKGFGWNETFENGANAKVRVPKEAKEGDNRQTDFDNHPTDRRVIPDRSDKEVEHQTNGNQKCQRRSILGNGQRLLGSV